MCGKVYLEIAENCLKTWYPGMPETEREALLARADFEELETYIDAKETIMAAIDAFNDVCFHYLLLPDWVF